jgi:KaiC/GvpD/RAD55 family RecA-like ATPase
MAEAAPRAGAPPGKEAPSRDEAVQKLAEELSVAPAAAEGLFAAGFTTPAEARQAPRDQLVSAGLSEEDAQRILKSGPPPQGDEALLSKWLASRSKPPGKTRPVRKAPPGSRPVGGEALRRWIAGDDSVLEAWVGEEGARALNAPAAAVPPVEAPTPALEASASVPVVSPPRAPSKGRGGRGAGATIPEDLREREEAVLQWLTELLHKARNESFEPGELLREAQELTRQLHDERTRRRELEEELEHVKKGSVAVIKYVRNREARAREEALSSREAEIQELKRQLESARGASNATEAQRLLGERDQQIAELRETLRQAQEQSGTGAGAQRELGLRFQQELEDKERAYSEREADHRRRIIQLEETVQNLRAERELSERHTHLAALEPKTLNGEMKKALDDLESRERSQALKENELKARLDELMLRADEMERKLQPVQFKEKELIHWEEALRVKEQTLQAEVRQLEEARKISADPEVVSKTRKLRDLESELSRKEEEMRTREQYLHQRLEELQKREREVSDEELEEARAVMKEEVETNKLRTGVPRLDDLLFGGLPLGTNVLVNGPAHTGKELLARMLAAEGLKKGAPILWLLSDKATTTVREEMTSILPAYPEYEKRGLVRYVDLYSMSLGITSSDPLVTMLSPDDKNLLESLSKAVDEAAATFRKEAEYYRLVFESVSTVAAYLDVAGTLRFLQPFVGRRKMERALCYYMVDAGMHSENDVQLLEHLMDGSINLKVDQLKTYLSVKGLGEVQSRAWIAYNFTRRAFNLGSFSLDHIR